MATEAKLFFSCFVLHQVLINFVRKVGVLIYNAKGWINHLKIELGVPCNHFDNNWKHFFVHIYTCNHPLAEKLCLSACLFKTPLR